METSKSRSKIIFEAIKCVEQMALSLRICVSYTCIGYDRLTNQGKYCIDFKAHAELYRPTQPREVSSWFDC